ncbi:MAG: hypothetical protein KF847_05890 [Pirellulales bacterium]|nr:hypothetical protein [Pirellulales bacterium]
MAEIPQPPPPPVAPPRGDSRPAGAARWQFSLLTLLKAMTLTAVACGAAVVLPYSLTLLATGALWIVGAGWLAAGVVFARGDVQAFCIGGSVVVLSMWTQAGGRMLEGVRMLFRPWGAFDLGTPTTAWLELAIVVLAVAANGWLGVRARRYFQTR